MTSHNLFVKAPNTGHFSNRMCKHRVSIILKLLENTWPIFEPPLNQGGNISNIRTMDLK